jgi:hypothetical protein
MRLIHASGFKTSEREVFRIVVFSNIISTIQTLLEALDYLDLKLVDPTLQVCKYKYKIQLHNSYFKNIGICGFIHRNPFN